MKIESCCRTTGQQIFNFQLSLFNLFDTDALAVAYAVGAQVVEFFELADCGAMFGGD